DAIIVCTLDHEITFWNQGAERIYGWSNAEAVGKNLQQLFFPREVPPQIQEAGRSMEKHGEWKGELQEHTKSGQVVTVNARYTLIRVGQGQPKAVLIINTDITEHKLLEEQFFRSQRQESLGSLVSGIAHDLNNTLMPILIGVEILEAEPLSEDAASMVHTMRSSARRSAEMVKQMLLFARGGESSKSLIRPDQLLKEMGKIINDTFPKSVTCLVRAEKNLHPLFAIPTQIHQVLMNLCVNARDAMSGDGTLTLAVENEHLDKHDAARLAGAREGDFVCFSVADTGAGIPVEQLEKIFQPFFTTKAPGKGTGLGLSTCQGIVKKHDGFITVDSKIGSGTVFKVYLPAAGVNPPEQFAKGGTALPTGRGEGILVVDDEESILAMTRAALENFGYMVSTAATGMAAITHFRGNPNAFSLVITDQVMPLMDGVTTVAALRKIRPDIKIIVASGSEKEMKTLFQNIRTEGFIAKPFTAEKMLSVVNQVLTNKAE
ncbi:MAG TPA: ATP-binding protein, partial [Candidatus Binatia bacterium]|nr:ATP-binding protein [Candidatus Binatia bacterium]